MNFTSRIGNDNKVRTSAQFFLSEIEKIGRSHIAICEQHNGSNYSEYLGVMVIKNHLEDIVRGETTVPISTDEILLLSNDLKGINSFVDHMNITSYLTGNNETLVLADSYRELSLSYKKMTDDLINNKELFNSYQPASKSQSIF